MSTAIAKDLTVHDSECPAVSGRVGCTCRKAGAVYVCGVGWMYTSTVGGIFQGRFGNYDTEEQALRNGAADLVKARKGAVP